MNILDDFEILDPIKGDGTTRKVRSKVNGSLFLVKTLNTCHLTHVDKELLLMKAEKWTKFDHAYLLKCFSYSTHPSSLKLILENVEGRNLVGIVESNQKEGKRLLENTVWKILIQSLLALEYIHANGTFHGDFQPHSIFLDINDNVKVGCFGDIILQQKESNTTSSGSEGAACNDRTKPGNKCYTAKWDIRTLGIALYKACMLKPSSELPGFLQNAVADSLLQDALSNLLHGYSSELKEVIMCCLLPETMRPMASELLQSARVVVKAQELNIDITGMFPRMERKSGFDWSQKVPLIKQLLVNGAGFAVGGVVFGIIRQYMQHRSAVRELELASLQRGIQAMRAGDADALAEELNSRLNINAADKEGWTLLLTACNDGLTELAELLVTLGADVQKAGMGGGTPLMLACLNGHVPLAMLLLSRGADVHRRNHEGSTALHIVSQSGHVTLTQLLLDKGADVHAQNKNAGTPLHQACLHGHLKVAQQLMDHGANLQKANRDGSTPLHMACKNGHLQLVQLLLKTNRVNMNQENHNWGTPLLQACKYGHEDVAKLLIRKGAMLQKNKDGWTPLHAACYSGSVGIVVTLLGTYGINVNEENNNGGTPLHLACLHGRTHVAQLLLKHGAMAHKKNKDGWTPLHSACKGGNSELVHTLLSYGAKMEEVTKEGWNPLKIAQDHGRIGVVALLQTFSA